MKPKVIITAYAHPCLQEELIQRGFDVDVREKIGYDELLDQIHLYHGLVVTTRIKVDQQLLDAATQLKWIGRLGSGMEIIDVDYAVQKNILCVSSPEGNKDAVAEQCLGVLLSMMHNVFKAGLQVRVGKWLREENRGIELGGKTVGIIGYGNTGSAFAALLAPFGVKVLAYDKYKTGFAKNHVQEVSLEELLNKVDVVSFHLPLNNETHYFANVDFFQSLQKPVFLLNASRGKIVNTAALSQAIDEGKIIAAGLDVIENENINSYTEEELKHFLNLANRENVWITPHIAGYSKEALEKMAKVLIFKLDEAGMG
ncbi:MAG: NAD(P)-dependent oxidoreductase [Chitinophagaceae bacterium]